MIRLLIPIILVILAIVLARRYILGGPIEEKNSRKITVLLIALTIGLLILTLFHRMHWLGAIVPALILAGRRLAASLSSIFGGKKENPRHTFGNDPSLDAREAEALKVLGLQKPYTHDDVIEAHRKLMQKLHPDRGGNDYLAAKINEAKDILLKK